MSSTTLPVCPKTGSTSPNLTVHLCLHTALLREIGNAPNPGTAYKRNPARCFARTCALVYFAVTTSIARTERVPSLSSIPTQRRYSHPRSRKAARLTPGGAYQPFAE